MSDEKKTSLERLNSRIEKTLDKKRAVAKSKRQSKGYRTARENLEDLVDHLSLIHI